MSILSILKSVFSVRNNKNDDPIKSTISTVETKKTPSKKVNKIKGEMGVRHYTDRNFMMKTIGEGCIIPKYYGIAWRTHDECYDHYVECYPIPINIIVRAYKHFYFFLVRGCFPSKYERELLEAYFRGRKYGLQKPRKF